MSERDPILVRDALVGDADSIAQFQIAMAMETEDKTLDPETVGVAVRTVFEDPGKGFYLAAEQGGEVIGSLLITTEWSDWRNHDIWYIQSVYVVESARGQGVFKRLYEKVVELAQTKGAKMIRLYVETENNRAQKVYESLGMKRMPYFMYDVKV